MTKTDLQDFIKRRLGYPAINIEITPEQLDDCIDEAISLFKEQHYNGSDIQYIKLPIVKGQQIYTLENDVNAVVDIYMPDSSLSLTDEKLLIEKPYLGNGTFISSSSSVLDYVVVEQTLAMINNQYIVEPEYDFNEITKKLFLQSTPDRDDVALLRVYLSDSNENLFTDRWFKKYVVAVAGVQWATNISKYEGNLPAGMRVNYAEIESRYTAQVEKLELELDEKYSAPPSFLVG